jgi:hypothetical protein
VIKEVGLAGCGGSRATFEPLSFQDYGAETGAVGKFTRTSSAKNQTASVAIACDYHGR